MDTIENMRDTSEGSGYIFIYTFDGVNKADPILKQNAGKNLINLKDPNGKLVIKEPDLLFERYCRENESRCGFGIGLNIIQAICNKNQVSVDVDSADGLTTFIYRFSITS